MERLQSDFKDPKDLRDLKVLKVLSTIEPAAICSSVPISSRR